MKASLTVCVAFWGLLVSASAQTAYSVSFAKKAYLGVTLRDVTADDVTNLGLEKERGVYIEEVSADTPAEDAGLQAGDVILTFSGIPVLSVSQFQRLVADSPEGRKVEMTIWRKGRELTLEATLGEAPGRGRSVEAFRLGELLEQAPFHDLDIEPGRVLLYSGRPRLGIQGQALNEQMAHFLGVPGKEGVLVTEVLENTPAESAGLKAGDVILAVDGEKVATPSELSKRLESETLELEIVRDKRVQKLAVEMEGTKKRSGGGTTRL